MTSKIEWTEDTWNPLAGCTIVSPGCKNCYAMREAHRFAQHPNEKVSAKYEGTTKLVKGKPVWTGQVNVAHDEALLKPLGKKKATMYFVNSMSDLFHENVPDEVIDRIFAIMALCPQHTFQVLTKRSARMREYLTSEQSFWRIAEIGIDMHSSGQTRTVKETCEIYGLPWKQPESAHDWWPLRNVWLGVSAEDQTRADQRIPDLLATPAAVRFVSAEPLLGPVDFCGITVRDERPGEQNIDALYCEEPLEDVEHEPWKNNTLDWVIVGGETGKGSRPMHPDWARDIREQCQAACVPFFFKQWGDWAPGITEDRGDGVWFEGNSGAISRGLTTRDTFDWFDGGTAPDGLAFLRVGKAKAGRLLDGVEHNAMPEVPL